MESIKRIDEMEFGCAEGRQPITHPFNKSAAAINSINFILIPLIKFDLADFVEMAGREKIKF